MHMTYAATKLPLPVRLLVFAVSACAGFAVQLLLGVTTFAVVLGVVVMVPGLVFMWAKNYRNKPLDLGMEDWQPVTAAEFDRVKTNLALTKRKSYSVFYRAGFGVFLFAVLLFLALAFHLAEENLVALFFFDAVVLLFPFLFSGNVALWTPQELAFKMHAFDTIIKSEPSLEGGEIIITPYLRLDKDKQGRRIPEDIRLMVEPRRKPADFLGVQFQVAINKGPNGSVPYMYGVFLCKGRGQTYQWVVDQDFQDMVTDPGGDKDYGYLVVRQPTSGTGYHTTDADIRRLYAMAKEKLEALKGTSARSA